MWVYVVKRSLGALIVFLVIVTLVWLGIRAIPPRWFSV
jgi:hypothetical protein